MKTGIRSFLTGAVATTAALAYNLAGGSPLHHVDETPFGANTEYNVISDTNLFSLPFTVAAFVVDSTGGAPFTSNPGWNAQLVDATSWFQPMAGDPANKSWAEFSQMTYTEAFPANPSSLEGFVVDFSYLHGIRPGTSLDGFFFPGAPDPTDRFMLIADHGPAIIVGQQITDKGTVEVVPEPGSLGLCLLAFTIAIRRKLH